MTPPVILPRVSCFPRVPIAQSQESLKTLIGFVDIVGLYFALTQLAIRNISFEHKIQAVGLGQYTFYPPLSYTLCCEPYCLFPPTFH